MITVIGDFAVDIFVNSDGFHYGSDTESAIATQAGGQGNHVAAWIAACEGKAALIGNIGHDVFGDFLWQEAKAQGIELAVSRTDMAETGKIVVLVDDKGGERSMFTSRGANLNLSTKQVKTHESFIASSDCLYISGYMLFKNGTYDAVKAAKQLARKHNVPVALDPSSAYFLSEYKERVLDFMKNTEWVFPNFEEGQLLTGKDKPEDIITELKNFVKHPVLKLGRQGCMMYDDGWIHLPARDVKVIDTTGAGDSFLGAFLSHYYRNYSAKDALKFANETAANTVQKFGGRPEIK
ncbi:fructokinase [Melghiribacillus thermohalophilus]|uniref:Fructokinase n=1 Tax=Melghiribacillus thermohalophilus TaxID=1324956 RepID=A0A4R3MQ23_9BACI|nr:carbohydrate kinase family protein [Melghiribacillus thermohalophilus]TCT17963.1 fructokinase [Melghiribacillus thermohalophilus]